MRKRLKFMQALTPVIQKLTNPTLRDYSMISIYEKDVFFIRNKGGSKETNLSTPKCSRTYELLVASTDALSLSYRILVSAKATKLGSCDKPGARNKCFSLQNISFGEANIAYNFLSLGDG